MADLNEFQSKIGYTFKNRHLLEQALTHSSYANEKHMKKHSDNERLEFLGDAVLEIVSSEFLFINYPQKPEGELTKLRASIVCEPTLALCTKPLDLGKYLRLGRGEDHTGGRKRKSILSDALEAVIGAIYLDGGFTNAKEFVLRFIMTDIENKQLFYDSKTILQELIQGRHEQLSYELIDESGPDHDKQFTVAVLVDGERVSEGEGRTMNAAAQQAAYHSILSGVKNLADEFQIPALEGKELYNVFFQMRLDHPEIFWVSSYKYRYYKDSPNLIFIPEYLFDKKKICEHQKAMTARVEKLIRPAQKLSEWEKEKYVHDFICENIRYDKLKKSYSHEIIGPLGQGVGVCEGIAKAVKVLLDALGVWCVIAICGNNPEKGIKYRHTWNIVKIGGTYYHLDATFDNTLGKDRETSEIRYDYFNLDDSQIFRDHEPLIAPAPHCGDHEHFYYKEKKLSFTKKEDVYKRSLQAAKKGRVLIFHWRGGYLTKGVLKELLELIRKAGDEKDKTAMVSINWPQAVIRVQYTDMQVQESVTIEEANEGEK